MVVLHGSPVVGVYGLLLAPVWLAVVIVHILPGPEASRSDHPFHRPLTRPPGGRTAGCSNPPRRCRRCPAPAPPHGPASHGATESCAGSAGL